MKINNIVLVENRLHKDSTQIYLEDVGFSGDIFFVPVGDYTKPIGYLKFKKIAKNVKKDCFELSGLVGLDYPNPNPKLSLSGVLYPRQKAIEAHQAVCSYQESVGRLP